MCDSSTFMHLRGKLAAGDTEVVGVLLSVELLQLQVPHPQVSISGATDKQLTTRAEGAGHHSGVRHSTRPISVERNYTQMASSLRCTCAYKLTKNTDLSGCTLPLSTVGLST